MIRKHQLDWKMQNNNKVTCKQFDESIYIACSELNQLVAVACIECMMAMSLWHFQGVPSEQCLKNS